MSVSQGSSSAEDGRGCTGNRVPRAYPTERRRSLSAIGGGQEEGQVIPAEESEDVQKHVWMIA